MMTVDVFHGYLEELPRLRAERLLDLAGAAHPSEGWYDTLVSTIRQASDGLEGVATSEPMPFTLRLSDPQGTGSFSGRISPRQLAGRVRRLQDSGYG